MDDLVPPLLKVCREHVDYVEAKRCVRQRVSRGIPKCLGKGGPGLDKAWDTGDGVTVRQGETFVCEYGVLEVTTPILLAE